MAERIDLDEFEKNTVARHAVWVDTDSLLALVRAVRAAMAVHDNDITTIGGEKAYNKLSVRNDQYDALTEALAPFRKEAT